MGTCDKLQALAAYKLINLNLKRQRHFGMDSVTSKKFCISQIINSRYYCAINTMGMDTRGAC